MTRGNPIKNNGWGEFRVSLRLRDISDAARLLDHCDLAPPSQAGRFYCPGSGVDLFTAK
jgi:hypothetical protein